MSRDTPQKSPVLHSLHWICFATAAGGGGLGTGFEATCEGLTTAAVCVCVGVHVCECVCVKAAERLDVQILNGCRVSFSFAFSKTACASHVLISWFILPANQATHLGVVMDPEDLKSAYALLKNTSRMRGLESQQDLEEPVHAFLFSRLDYCDDAFTRLCKKPIRKLQSSLSPGKWIT